MPRQADVAATAASFTPQRPLPPAVAPIRDRLCIGFFQLFLIAVYFIPKNTSAKLMIAALAAMVLTDRDLLRHRLPPPFLWALAGIAILAGWSALGFGVNRVAFGPASEAVASFALVGLVLLAGRRLLACWSLDAILISLVAMAALSAAGSVVLHLAGGFPFSERMVPLGRAVNPIPAAAGLCIAVIAAAVLLRGRPRLGASGLALFALAVLALLAAIGMTQSRGPMIALLLALVATALPMRGSGTRIFVVALLAWAATTSLVIFDPQIRAFFCHDELSFCRPASRIQIWSWVLDNVVQRPVFGLGSVFRFDDAVLSHPHNGLFGVLMFFGAPALVLTLAMAAAFSVRIAGLGDRLGLFCVGALVFSFAYMGADLPNPFAFANTHYLFLWLPVAFGLSGRDDEGR